MGGPPPGGGDGKAAQPQQSAQPQVGQPQTTKAGPTQSAQSAAAPAPAGVAGDAISASAVGQARELLAAIQEYAQLLGLRSLGPAGGQREPTLSATEQAILADLDALPEADRKAFFLGNESVEAAKIRERMKTLMDEKLKALKSMQDDGPNNGGDGADSESGGAGRERGGAEPGSDGSGLRGRPLPKKDRRKMSWAGPKQELGQRSRTDQANLFFRKVMATGDDNPFFKDHPIYVDKEGQPTSDRVTGRLLQNPEWRKSTYMPIRIKAALEYSALPSLSRHHWGTDVDVYSTEQDDWKGKGRLNGMGAWLEANRDILPLATTFSGDRGGKGYHDEPWHLTMREMGTEMHRRFNEQVRKDEIIESVLQAFDAWSKNHRNAFADIPKETARNSHDVLRSWLEDANLQNYVDGVNPDVKPGGPE